MQRIATSRWASMVLLLLTGSSSILDATVNPPGPAPEITGPKTGKPAPGMFLVARRGFLNPYFNQTVIYLIYHDLQASYGLIVNQPGTTLLSDAVPDVQDTHLEPLPVYHGGPVDPHMLVMLMRHRQASGLAFHVSGDIYASTDLQLLDELPGKDRQGEELRCYLGYAGWAPGQLDYELRHHYWHVVEGDPAEVFGADTGALWDRLIGLYESADSLAADMTGNPMHHW